MSRRIEGVFVACRSICCSAILALPFTFLSTLSTRSEVFQIPAQPLATAIDAFCAATGAEVYYDGAAARGQRSSVVTGEHGRDGALRVLLAGTDLVPLNVRAGAYVLINPGDDAARALAAAQSVQDARYQEYFVIVQQSVLQNLCGFPDRAEMQERMVIRLWIDGAGAVRRLEPGGHGDVDYRTSEFHMSLLRNLRLPAAPPPHMPQPVTLALLLSKTAMASYCPQASLPPGH